MGHSDKSSKQHKQHKHTKASSSSSSSSSNSRSKSSKHLVERAFDRAKAFLRLTTQPEQPEQRSDATSHQQPDDADVSSSTSSSTSTSTTSTSTSVDATSSSASKHATSSSSKTSRKRKREENDVDGSHDDNDNDNSVATATSTTATSTAAGALEQTSLSKSARKRRKRQQQQQDEEALVLEAATIAAAKLQPAASPSTPSRAAASTSTTFHAPTTPQVNGEAAGFAVALREGLLPTPPPSMKLPHAMSMPQLPSPRLSLTQPMPLGGHHRVPSSSEMQRFVDAPSLEFRMEEPPRNMTYIRTKDVQNAVQWAFELGSNPPWIFFRNRHLIKKIVVILVGCLDLGEVGTWSHMLPFMCSLSRPIKTVTPGHKNRLFSAASAMLYCSPSDGKKKPQQPATSVSDLPQIPIMELVKKSKALVLSPQQLIDNEYSLPSAFMNAMARVSTSSSSSEPEFDLGAPISREVVARELENFVSTKKLPDVSKDRLLLALDCEMCLCGSSYELTRVSVVDSNRQIVYETLVKPAAKITDYLTRFSGITEEMLQNVNTSLKDVQKVLLELISADCILIGHSLENDLRALKLYHTNVIDTSVLFPHPHPPAKMSLKSLAQRYLNKSIQSANVTGHDPTEDAVTALELVILRVYRGDTLNEEAQESIFQQLARAGVNSAVIDKNSIVQPHLVAGNSNSAAAAAASTPKSNLRAPKPGVVHASACESDAQSIEAVLSHAKPSSSTRFIFTQLHSLTALHTDATTTHPAVTDKDHYEAELRKIDGWIQAVYEALPPHSLLIVSSGQGKPGQVRALWDRKSNAKNDEEWSQQDEMLLERLVTVLREGLSFFALKPTPITTTPQ